MVVVELVVIVVKERISFNNEVHILVTSAYGGTNNAVMITVLVI